ncbi:alpha/beta fold hydrolase [Radiobacillus sp. PE A8.2]|uniref:alpha/beta hydrolase n=1 Tax=Radiobacillus sp. PE A8.2 TaxID=3380349 RepID=UPI00388CFA6B
MKTVELLDATLHYKITGKHREDKPTLIFLHGVGLDHTEFNFIIPYLENYRIITYDLRWHGNSIGEFYDRDEENWNALKNDFLAIVEQEAVGKLHLVSHGIGAQLAVELISRELIKPTTNTIISTPFYYPEAVAKKGMQYRAEKIAGMSGAELGTWMIPQIMVNTDEVKHATIQRAFEKVQMDLYMDIFRLHANAISLEKLKYVTVPTLLLNGEMDVNYPPELTNLSIRYLPNTQLKVVKHASNMVHVDQPERAAALLEEFFHMYEGDRSDRIGALDLPYLDLLHEQLDSFKIIVRIDFLTIFSMQVNGKQVEGKWNQRKAKELIAYLAFHGKSMKETISESLWPNRTKDHAQNQLRVAIHHLRTILKQAGLNEFIHTDSQYVWITDQIDLNCDVKEALEGKVSLPPAVQLFTDLKSDWTMPIQYRLEDVHDSGVS